MFIYQTVHLPYGNLPPSLPNGLPFFFFLMIYFKIIIWIPTGPFAVLISIKSIHIRKHTQNFVVFSVRRLWNTRARKIISTQKMLN